MSTFSEARSQFIRALDIVDSTQLTVFLQRDLTDRSVLLDQVAALESEPLDSAVQGMQTILGEFMAEYNDPFANYINPKQHKAYTQRRTGGFVGLGLKFRALKDDYPVVIGPLLGGPLENRNLQPGDKIISIAGVDQHAATSRDVSGLMRGEPGTKVSLLLQRGQATHELLATRQAVQLHYARSDILDSQVGYLKVSRFGGNTHVRFRQLLEGLLQQNIKALVLDLRDNPGGSTRAARAMMSVFDRSPWVFCEQYKTGKVNRLPRHGDWLTDIPLAVLVNEYSMSSAEILAGALQDYKRAVLVGSPTYGKGLIQKVYPLAEPFGGAIRTTIAMYGTPSHRLLHGRGLLPDVYVSNAPERLFKETGSVNISAEAREFRQSLFIKQLSESLSPEVATAYSTLPDMQLQVAIARIT